MEEMEELRWVETAHFVFFMFSCLISQNLEILILHWTVGNESISVMPVREALISPWEKKQYPVSL